MRNIKHLFFLLFLCLGMTVETHAQDGEIWVSFPSNPNREENGVYGFPANDPSAIEGRKNAPELYFRYGMGYQDGKLYGMNFQQGFFTADRYILYAIDTNNWTMTQRDVDKKFSISETASGMDGTVYALFADGMLGTVDYVNLVRTDICQPTRNYVALGVTGVDELYGIDNNGNLVSINTTNGSETVKGQIEGFGGASTGEIDPVTNQFYYCTQTNYYGHSKLYSVNLNSLQRTEVGEFPSGYDYFGDMVIVGEPAAAGSPAKATNLTAVFEGNSLSGTFSFTAPTETFDHQELTGELNYTLTYGIENGTEQTVQGTVEVGATVTLPLTLEEGGNVTFVVKLANEVGEGQTASLTQWIGPDAPQAPTNVVLSMTDGGQVNLTWTAPTECVNGGYMGTLTYNIYRIVDGEETLAAQGVSGTTFTEQIEITTLKEYVYAVAAVNDGTPSARALSNKQVAGDGFGVPFVEHFGEGNRLEYFTVVNVNGDSDRWGELTWKLHTSSSYLGGDVTNFEEMWCQTDGATDDWLFTPAVQLQPGNAYVLRFKMKVGYEDTPEKFEVMFGRSAAIDAMTTMLIPERTINNTSYAKFEKEFIVDEAASYCFGFHATPNKGSSLYLDDIEIRVNASPAAPARVENLAIEAEPAGQLQTTISFNAPTKTIAGDALTSITKIEVLREETVIATIDQPAVGSAQTLTDDGPVNGYNYYTVIAYNEEGNGLRTEAAPVYVGVDVPQAPVVTMIQDNGQSVHFEWAEVPATGENGYVVRPEEVTYEVYATNDLGQKDQLIYTGTDRQVDADYTDTENFDIAKWIVVAKNAVGSSRDGVAKIATGWPLTLPYRETFAMGHIKASIWTEQDGVRSFNPSTMDAAGEDAGSLMFMPYTTGDYSSFNTQRLTFVGVKTPVLTFSHKAEAGSEATLVVKAWQPDGTETVFLTVDYSEATSTQWKQETIDLTPLKPQSYIVMKFLATGVADQPIFIDDVTIADSAFDDPVVIPTSVNAVVEQQPTEIWYDLLGRRVSNNSSTRQLPNSSTIYIVNGKKVIK